MEESFAEEVTPLHAAAPEVLARLLASTNGVAEIFAEQTYRELLTHRYDRWRAYRDPWEDFGTDLVQGTGLRTLAGGSSRHGSVQGYDPAVVRIKADELRGGDPVDVAISRQNPRGSLALPPDRIERVSLEEKRALLQAAVDAALSLEPKLRDLEVSFQGSTRRTYVASTQDRPTFSAASLIGIRVQAKYERNERRVDIYAIAGGVGGVGQFLTRSPENVAQDCIERLQAVLGSKPIDRNLGDVPVVIEGGWGGVWLHEAVGHLLEADTPGSYTPSKIGQQVAPANVTIVDDGTFTGGRGSALFDDEGFPSQRTTLIENGILRALMADRRQAHLLDIPRTGNGRRQDYHSEPMTRMTNLMLLAGEAKPDDLVAEAGEGLYVRTIGRGRLYPSDDRFEFNVLEGYLIENGRLGTPATDLRITGRPSDMLRGIRGVGSDFTVDLARGICEKHGQTVPVSVGMPTVLLSGLTVSKLR